uniref:Integrase catalytic domain-containing protein n=1 Tax=Strongyloides papillosus TaxID=174720 RepID=A0A0N5CIF0_STREA
MLEDMKRIWQDCEQLPLLKQSLNLTVFGETLNVDYIQLDDNLYVRFVYTAVTKRQDQSTTLLQLMKCFFTFGFPKVLRKDGGSGFIGNKVSYYHKSVNVTHYVSLPHNHTSNAFAEQFNPYAYNRSKHTSTGYPPCYFILNTADKFSDEISVNSLLSGLKDFIQFGRTEFSESKPKRKGKVLSPGMFVMRRVLHKKLNHTLHKNRNIFEGPYKIIKHLHADTYIIQKCSRTGRITGREERVTTDRLKIIPSLSTTPDNT